MRASCIIEPSRKLFTNIQTPGQVNCTLKDTFEILVEGDTELVEEIISLLNTRNRNNVKIPLPKASTGILIIPSLNIIVSNVINGSNKAYAEVVHTSGIKFKFVNSVNKSSEKIINTIMSNNLPILKLYIQDATPKPKGKAEELKKMREFILSNYQRDKFDPLTKSRGELEEKDSKKFLENWWGVISVAKISKAQLKNMNTVNQ